MKYSKKVSIFFILLSCMALRSFAQDATFTQGVFNPLYLNPAFAGSNEGIRIVTNYRNQWTYVPGTYSTYSVSMDSYEPKMNSGIGVQAICDHQGEGFLTTTSIGGIYQYGFKLRENSYLAFGLGGNFGSKYIDWSKLQFSDQFNAYSNDVVNATHAPIPGSITRNYGDAQTGVLFKTKWYCRKSKSDNLFTAGFAVQHLLQPTESLLGVNAPIPVKYTFHTSLTLPLLGNYFVKGGYIFPSLVISKQANFYETLLGVYTLREPFILGLAYHNGVNGTYFRNTNALAVLAGIQKPFNGSDFSMQFVYSYDVNVTGLGFSSAGAHEISAIIFFDGKSILGSHHNDLKESPCLKVRRKGYLPPL